MHLLLSALLIAAAPPPGTPVYVNGVLKGYTAAPTDEQKCAQHRSNYFADLDLARLQMLKAAAHDYHWPDMKAAKALLDQAVVEAERYRSCWKAGTQEPYDNQEHD